MTAAPALFDRVVVGVDESPDAVRALAAAEALGRRLRASVRVIAASRATALSLSRSRPGLASVEFAHDAAGALLDASTAADLVVVGHRGGDRRAPLAEAGARLLHGSTSSVMVVR